MKVLRSGSLAVLLFSPVAQGAHADETTARSVQARAYLRVTSERQCNNATVRQSGGENQPELARDFGRITCAERVIRCTGNCK